MSFEWFVALRYLREGRSQTTLIVSAVALGVGVLVFLTALMSGLQANLLEKTLGSQAHLIVHPPDAVARPLATVARNEIALTRVDKPSLRPLSIGQYAQLLTAIRAQPGVLAATPVVSGSAFVVRGALQKSVTLRGIDPESFDRVIPIASKIREGRYRLSGASVLLGTDLANDLGVGVDDKIRIVTAEGLSETFSIVGLFDLGSKELNQRWVLTPLRSAQTLFNLAGAVSAIEAKVADVFAAETIAAAIAARTSLVADSWMRNNPQLLVALQSQASSTNIIQFFITLTVALGIASVLIVSVVQKSREIGILRAFGTQSARVLRIFLIEGALVGLAGSLVGAGLGVGLARLFVTVQRGADGGSMFPIPITWQILVLPVILATLVGLVAAVVPARRAARLDPAQVIRNG